MNNKIFVGNLAHQVTERELRAVFERFGDVLEVKLVVDATSGLPRGFALVTMARQEASLRAIDEMNGTPLKGRPLRLTHATPQPRASSPSSPSSSARFRRRRAGRSYPGF